LSTVFQIVGLSCVVLFVCAFVSIVVFAAGFYAVGAHRRAALDYLVGSISERLRDPGVLDSFLAEARREEVLNFVGDAIHGRVIGPSRSRDKDWQRLTALARQLRQARRGPVESDRLDRVAATLLDDPRRVAELKEKRVRLHDAMQQHIRDRVAASCDSDQILRGSRRWMAREERRLTFAALRDVALPGIKRLGVEAKDQTTYGGIVGLAVGVVALLVLAVVKQRPDLIVCLGTGTALGGAFGLALTITRCLREVVRAAEERPLARVGIWVTVGGFYLTGAVLFSLGAFGVKYNLILALALFTPVEVVGLMLLSAEVMSRRLREIAHPERR
jgi:hypothetical protein